MVDINAYFSRINYSGSTEPTLATLQALHALHPAAIPFENINVLLDKGIDLNLSAIEHKLITQQRGGYCFEQNGLFKTVLEALGFELEPLIARVLWMRPTDLPLNPQTHMVLRVKVDNEWWLADVGFGGVVLTNPLRFATESAQPTYHKNFCLVKLPYGYRLEVLLPNKEAQELWRPVCEASNEPQARADYEVANWYTSSHPQSHFRRHLMAATTITETRYTLLNNHFTERKKNQSQMKKELTLLELETVLKDRFGLPVEDSWRVALERVMGEK